VLHERSDFADLLTTVGDRVGANAALVEKDYWVTEALRAIAADFSSGAIFKGGTSLSKAWNIIRRFSEDIDLLVRSEGEGLDTGGARDRYMRTIQQAVGGIDGLTLGEGGRSERGISRTAVFLYEPKAPALDGLQPTIILEMGIRGGAHPTAERTIQSLLGAALAGTEIDDPTLAPFEMVVLDPRRTLVEKLFAIHCACELWTEGRRGALQRQGRHLYDIYFLLADAEVAAFVGSDECRALIPEIDEFGRTYFERDHRTPDGMSFATSRALAPQGDLRAAVEAEYARSAFLFYGEFPDFASIYERIEEVRGRL
jgi:hypothetical protein